MTFRMYQICSIGLKSGELGGHSRDTIPTDSFHCLASLQVWIGEVSSCKTTYPFISDSSIQKSSRYSSKILTYFCPLSRPFGNMTIGPLLPHVKEPHIMIEFLPALNDGVRQAVL